MIDTATCVLLINYNSVNDTLDCIKSIQASANAFIVIVENGSNDINTIEEKLAGIDNIKLLISKSNLGFGGANNLGIEWIKGNVRCDYIFILNNDTIVEPGAIGILEDYMQTAPDSVVMAAPKIFVYSNPSEIWYGGGTFDYKKVTPTINKDPNIGRSKTLFATGCAMFFRAGELYANGGFDPFFFMYDEDVELSMRINAAGKSIMYLPDAVIYHKCQGSQAKADDLPENQLDPRHPSLNFYLTNTIINRRYIISKFFKGGEQLTIKIKHSIYWIMKSAQYLLHGKINQAVKVVNLLFFSSIKTPVK